MLLIFEFFLLNGIIYNINIYLQINFGPCYITISYSATIQAKLLFFGKYQDLVIGRQ